MERTDHRKSSRHLGSLLAGLSLASLGGLQYLQGYFGIPWSELWPLFLIVPGVAVVIGALTNTGPRHGRTHAQRE